MKHVFASPHPDDAALSCGGLIALLREAGQDVALVTIFSGPGLRPRLTPYQRLALGFGSQHRAQQGDDEEALLHASESPDGADESADPGADVPTPAEVMAVRRAEDSAYAESVGAEIVHINRPDAVFRDYQGGSELMGSPRANDPAPVPELRAALAALAPDRLYIPFSIGGHVDHRQARRAASAILGEGPSYAANACFYEDFPYSLTVGFETLDQLDPDVFGHLPQGAALAPEYVELGNALDAKIDNLEAYASQLGRLFGGDDPMGGDVRKRAARVGELGGVGPAERYWRILLG